MVRHIVFGFDFDQRKRYVLINRELRNLVKMEYLSVRHSRDFNMGTCKLCIYRSTQLSWKE